MKRLTTPEVMDLRRRLYPTGNHFVSLPVISAGDAGIDRVGALHMGTVSLVEFGGRQAGYGAETLPPLEPLLRPFAMVPGGGGEERVRPGQAERVRPGPGADQLTWCRLGYWVPRFEWREPVSGLVLEGTIFAPIWRDGEGLQSHKGFVLVLEVKEPGRATAVGLTLAWQALVQTVYTSRPLPAAFTVRRDRWTGGPVLEPRSGGGAGPVALAVSFSLPSDRVDWSEIPWPEEPGDGIRLEFTIPLAGPERTAGSAPLTAAFYFGLNREGDGARTVAVDLSRHGWSALLDQTLAALDTLTRHVDPDRCPAPEDAAVLEERLNLNLLFNYFFAAGRTIDTEDLVLVTSRSPLYYVSAAFWARDALLWSFPGLLLADPALAEAAIGAAFDRYFHHAGIHSLYLDGTLLYPGFELDELAAYPIALWRYITATGDRAILGRRGLGSKLRRILALMAARRHPDPAVDLYSTFLLPSDDPASHPYVTYDNMTAWLGLWCTADLLDWDGAAPGETAALRRQAESVRAAVYRHCVVPRPDGGATPMFAWSVDLAGGLEVGDEPPGSLELLSYYGFCRHDDPVWTSTLEWLHSPDHEFRYAGPGVEFPGLGCPHSRHPFVMGLFNALLGGLPERAREAGDVLVRAPLDTGLACEAFDRHTGEVKTGAAFATCAGFLAYAMDQAYGRRDGVAAPTSVRPGFHPGGWGIQE